MVGIGTIWSKLFLRMHGKAIRNSFIHKTARVHYGSNVLNSKMDAYSYCGYDCWLINTDVKKYCSIGANVRIGGAMHPISFVSSSPVFHKGKNILDKNFSKHELEPTKRTIIGNDVWIAENVMIKAGVKISDGAVIGMGSIVTHDVGPYEIWAGNPAKLIRKRFDDETIEKLLQSKWWDRSEDEISALAQYFNNPEEFLKNI